jgi:hypothetical protein
MKNCNNFEAVSMLCKRSGFRKRGKAFFRIIGDGVLQVMKYSVRTTPWRQEDIHVGLFSIYGELEEQWLTASGCIPRYQVRWLDKDVKDRWISSISGLHLNGHEVSETHTWEIDIPFMESTIIPYLDSIDTQRKLASAMMYMDVEAQEVYGRTVGWNDILKCAPFLHCGDYENAAKVIRAITEQHESALSRNRLIWTPEQYQRFISTYEPEAQKLQYLLRISENRDADEASQYLQANYNGNLKLTRFLR